MSDRRKQIVAVVVRFLVIIMLLGIAIFLFQTAPYFKPRERFKRGVIRVVVDDKEVTNYLPDPVYVENDVVMMSSRTAMKYFDNIYVYYDKEYDTTIITSEDVVGKIKTGEHTVQVNGEEKKLKGTTTFSGDTLFLPISSLEEVTRVDIDWNQKVIATTPRGRSRVKIVRLAKDHSLKAYQRELALVTGVGKAEELLYIFDTEGKKEEEYLTVRTERGDLGYYQYGRIVPSEIVSFNQGSEIMKYQGLYDEIKFVLAWDYKESRTGQAKVDRLNILSPTWLEVKNEEGDLTVAINQEYLKWAKEQNYQLWPCLKNDQISMKGLEGISTIMNDMKLREKLIQNVVKVAIANGFDGINLDFENMYKEDKEVFSQFVREFASTLRANELVSSVDVTVAGGSDNYSLCYDRTAIGKAADYVMLMAYDQYGSWSRPFNKVGPTASLEWVESNVKEMLEYEGVSKDKLFVCVPFYYNDWTIEKETDTAIAVYNPFISNAANDLEKYKEDATWDESAGQYYIESDIGNGKIKRIWVENEDSLRKKIEIINKYDLAGVAIWRWGYESGNGVWKTIADNLNVQ